MKAAFAIVILALSAAAPAARAESFASWSSKAQKAEKRGDAAEAVEDYNNALRMWKSAEGKKAKAKVLTARGWLYAATGSTDKALEDFSASAKLDANNSLTFFRKGRVQFDQGRYSDAISNFYKATKLNLNYREAYFYRGYAYEKQGDAQFAREDYKTACRLGLKAACSEAARAKAQAALAAGKSDAFEAAPAEPEKQRAVVEVKKARKKPRYQLDWPACLSSLNACVDAGGAFGDCVKQAKLCESAPENGCCPKDCVRRYNESVDQSGMSEAEAFRTVFVEKPSCTTP